MTPNAEYADTPPPSFDVTYCRADGEDMGDYSFALSIESCENDAENADEPQAYLKETWQRVAIETIWIKPATFTCEADDCDEDSDEWVQIDGKWRQFCLTHNGSSTGGDDAL